MITFRQTLFDSSAMKDYIGGVILLMKQLNKKLL